MKRSKNKLTGFLAVVLFVCAVFGTSVRASDSSIAGKLKLYDAKGKSESMSRTITRKN